jgi:sulfate/thiosulfate-binding protein
MRGCDDADIDRDRLTSTHTFDLMVLQDTQQSNLSRQWEFSDLIQEQRPAIGTFKPPLMLIDRSCEGLQKVKDATPEDRARADQVAREFIGNLFRKVPVLDSGARGATSTFLQRGIGDVLLTWENEAYMAIQEAGVGDVEIVVPSISILASPPVTVVDQYAERHGTRAVAEAYLNYLYSEEGQKLASKHFFRPVSGAAARRAPSEAGDKIELFKLEDIFGDWKTAQKTHFDDGGSFDQLYQPEK